MAIWDKVKCFLFLGNFYQWSGPGGDAMDVDRSRAPALPLSTEVSEPAPRRGMGRLAALAQNIHDWEDDLSHPTIK